MNISVAAYPQLDDPPHVLCAPFDSFDLFVKFPLANTELQFFRKFNHFPHR